MSGSGEPLTRRQQRPNSDLLHDRERDLHLISHEPEDLTRRAGFLLAELVARERQNLQTYSHVVDIETTDASERACEAARASGTRTEPTFRVVLVVEHLELFVVGVREAALGCHVDDQDRLSSIASFVD